MKDNIYLLLTGVMAGIFFIVFLFILLQAKTQNRILLQKKMIAEQEIQHQRELTRLMISSQENERRRIGMDLHDEVGTVLSALRMQIEKINNGSPELIDLTAAGKRSIDNVITSVRRISHNLSPFIKGENGLRDGLEDIADQVNGANAVKVSFDFNGIEKFGFLGEETQLALYRIVSELINNTVKHAKATQAHLDFNQTALLLLVTYRDNGIGTVHLNSGERGIGMANIESRCNAMNATYTTEQNKAKGFGIEIKIPINA